MTDMAPKRNGLRYHTAGGCSPNQSVRGSTTADTSPSRSIWEIMAAGVRDGAVSLEEAMSSARAMDADEGPSLLAFAIGTDEAWDLAEAK